MRHPLTVQRLSVGLVAIAAVGALGTATASATTVSAPRGSGAAQAKTCAAWNHDVQILDRVHTGALYAHNSAVVASSSSALNDYTTAASAEGCNVSPG